MYAFICDISTDLVHMPVLSTVLTPNLSPIEGPLSGIHKRSNQIRQARLDTLVHSVERLLDDSRFFGRQVFV